MKNHQLSLPNVDKEYISCMSSDEMSRFVDDFVSNRIFTDRHVKDPLLVGTVFMPVSLGLFENWSDTGLQRIGLIWEFTHKACLTSVNGMPCFTSCHLMNADDWETARKAIVMEQKRRRNLTIEEE